MKETALDIENTLALNQAPALATPSRAWLVCLCASLFFFYEFIQMNMFNALSTQIMLAFHINATQLGQMSSFYFISNVLFLFPAGMLLDRYSTRQIILLSLGICILGTAAFSFVSTLGWAMLFRFMTGIGSAFCFLSVIRLSTRWFPSARLALVTGVVVTMAMLGGMAAQTPLTLLAKAGSWRMALLIDAIFGLAIFMAIFFVVKDHPEGHAEHHHQQRQQIRQLGYWKSMGLAFLKIQNWLGGLYTCFMNLPMSLLGGIWGVLYLYGAHHIAKMDGSWITIMLFFGTVVGGPIVGWWSDRIGLRRVPMITGAILSLALILVIMLVPHLSFAALLILFFAVGFATSTQIVAYPTVAENSIPFITAMSVSVVNITTMSGQAIFQPFFGKLMDMHANQFHHASGDYLASDFTWAMLIFPIAFVVALITAFCLRETHCHPRGQDDVE